MSDEYLYGPYGEYKLAWPLTGPHIYCRYCGAKLILMRREYYGPLRFDKTTGQKRFETVYDCPNYLKPIPPADDLDHEHDHSISGTK